jgi:hypothetical protein
VDSDGNLTIKDADTFNVTSDGKLTATSATIGGWDVQETSITNGGISLNADADDNPGIYSTNWKTLSDGTTEFNNL